MRTRRRFVALLAVVVLAAGAFTYVTVGQIVTNTERIDHQQRVDRELEAQSRKLQDTLRRVQALQRRAAACVPDRRTGKARDPKVCKRILDNAIQSLSERQRQRLTEGDHPPLRGR